MSPGRVNYGVAILLVLSNGMACGAVDGAAPIDERHKDVLTEISHVLNEAIPCEPIPKVGQIGDCQFVSVGFSPKVPSERSLGQRILVLDAGMRFAAYTRYKSRVLDDIEPNIDGKYESVQRPIELQRGALKILSGILNDKFQNVPAEYLNPVEDQFNRTFPNHVYPIRHGELIFGTLADLNPNAEFVIAQTFDIPRDLICHADEELTEFAALKHYFNSASSSLKDIIQRYNISFVNLSLGHSIKTVSEVASKCSGGGLSSGSIRTILDIIKNEFYDNLFSLADVIFVQSGPWSQRQLNLGDPEYPIDCYQYPNRIRTGYAEFTESTIPPTGSMLPSGVALGQSNARKCIDVFFNTGVEGKKPYAEGQYPYRMTMNGIGSSSMPEPFCTSWAAPFVLSYLNFERQSLKERGQYFSLARLLNSNFVFDPFKHRQFDAFRLGGI